MDFFYYVCLTIVTLSLSYYIFMLFQVCMSFISTKRSKNKSMCIDTDGLRTSANVMPLTIIVPVITSDPIDIEWVQGLFSLGYPEYEVVILCDSRRNDSHETMLKTFSLVQVEGSIRKSIRMRRFRGLYQSGTHPNLRYVDKAYTGLSDMINCGVNVSQYPLVTILEHGMTLENDALLKLGYEFLTRSDTVISSGVVRNTGFRRDRRLRRARYRDGVVIAKGHAELMLPNIYATLSSGHGTLAIYSKSAVIGCGGFTIDHKSTHMDISFKLLRYHKAGRRHCRVTTNNTVVGNMAGMGDTLPTSWIRWQSGLRACLTGYKGMTLNPRYGFLGLLTIPYLWIFELLLVYTEILGYVLVPALALSGLIPIELLYRFLMIIPLQMVIGLTALIAEQTANPGYIGAGNRVKLMWTALTYPLGVHQYSLVVRGFMRMKQAE